jgi:hypothetical protein
MRQAANAAIAVVFRRRREHALHSIDPEDATCRSGSGPAIRRCRRKHSFDAGNPSRDVAEKGNGNRWNREAQQVLQIEVPIFEAILRHPHSPDQIFQLRPIEQCSSSSGDRQANLTRRLCAR